MSELQIINSITFFGFASLILIFAVFTIFSKKIVYSLLFSVFTFFSIGAIIFSLGAGYNAVIQILIYGIAVPILLLLAVMFTPQKKSFSINISYSPRLFIAFLSCSISFLLFWYSVKFSMSLSESLNWILNSKSFDINNQDVMFAVSEGIYHKYYLPLILFCLITLIVVVGITTLNIVREKKRGN